MTRHRSWNRPLSDRGFRMSEQLELSEPVVCTTRSKFWAESSHFESQGPLQATNVESITKSPAIVPSDGPLVAERFSVWLQVFNLQNRQDEISSPQRDTMESCRHGEGAV